MGVTGKLCGQGGRLSTTLIQTRQSAKSAAMELGAADGVVDHGRSVAEQLAMFSQQFENLETNFAKRIEGVEEDLAEAKAMAAAAKPQVAVLEAALAVRARFAQPFLQRLRRCAIPDYVLRQRSRLVMERPVLVRWPYRRRQRARRCPPAALPRSW
jgi:hypothetical protein